VADYTDSEQGQYEAEKAAYDDAVEQRDRSALSPAQPQPQGAAGYERNSVWTSELPPVDGTERAYWLTHVRGYNGRDFDETIAWTSDIDSYMDEEPPDWERSVEPIPDAEGLARLRAAESALSSAQARVAALTADVDALADQVNDISTERDQAREELEEARQHSGENIAALHASEQERDRERAERGEAERERDRLADIIKRADKMAAGRWDEWGTRALAVSEILEEASAPSSPSADDAANSKE
jgi:hypothetical protein